MRQLYIFLFLFFTFAVSAVSVNAQTLKGVVMELNTSSPIAQVNVRNLTTDQVVETNPSGEFATIVKPNELLSFSYPGYRVDTLVVTNHEFKRVYLTAIEGFNILRDVEITELSDAQLDEQIEIARQQGKVTEVGIGEGTRNRHGGVNRGGIAISPSRLFGKEAKAARARYDLLVAEKMDRAIMDKFNPLLITSLTPLRGQELDLFIVRYKPTYEFIMESDNEQIRLYIMDSFKEFNSLPQAEKDKIKLENRSDEDL